MTVISIKDLERFAAESEKLEILQKELAWLYYPVSSPNGKENLGGMTNTPSNPTAAAITKINNVTAQIIEQQAVVAERIEAINAWLDTLTDEELVRIIRWHYMEGLTWRDTCRKVYGYYDRHVCRKRVMRYFGVEK